MCVAYQLRWRWRARSTLLLSRFAVWMLVLEQLIAERLDALALPAGLTLTMTDLQTSESNTWLCVLDHGASATGCGTWTNHQVSFHASV